MWLGPLCLILVLAMEQKIAAEKALDSWQGTRAPPTSLDKSLVS